MQTSLSLDSLGELDNGSARAIIDAEIRRAVQDMDDRGEDGKPRKVEITLSLERMDNGLVAAHVEAATRLPRRRTASTVAQIGTRQGQAKLLFQTMAPDDPNQRTLDEVQEKNP